MPFRNKHSREEDARRTGKDFPVKKADLGIEDPAASPHAEKKSGHVVGRAEPGGRSVGPRKPPGAGKMASPPIGDSAERLLPEDPKRRALPREEAAYRRAVEGHPDRLSPGKKGRGEF